MNAVVTLSIGNADWLKAGLYSKKAYAKRIGADFVNITESRLGGSVASEKYQIGAMLDRYDQVFYLDADTVIDPSAPNIFNEVATGWFGCFDESKNPLGGKRESLMAWLKDSGSPDSCPFYINNGVFVCSKDHQWLFDHAGLRRDLDTYEQTHMCLRIWEALRGASDRSISVYWLGKLWNYMPRCWVGNKVSPLTGWVSEPPPDQVYVHHFPCHKPEERLTAMEALNKEYGL